MARQRNKAETSVGETRGGAAKSSATLEPDGHAVAAQPKGADMADSQSPTETPEGPRFLFEDADPGKGGGQSSYVDSDMLAALLEVLTPGGKAKVLPGLSFDTDGKAASAADRWRVAIGKALSLSEDGRGDTGIHAGRVKREDGRYAVKVWRSR